MIGVVILGSTGSVGTHALEVIAAHPDRFHVVGLTARRDGTRLEAQIRRFRPQVAHLADPVEARRVEARCRRLGVQVLTGPEDLEAVAAHPKADLTVAAIVGAAGLLPTMAAIRAGKNIALANKETLVMAGALVAQALRRTRARLIPVDSEHSAIFQCLRGARRHEIRRLILTASGGPFRTTPQRRLRSVTPREALRHPTWRMGRKITIDSATLMNKGLEVVEAHWLFRMPPEQIEVVIHPQSIIHSLVEFTDGSLLAQMGPPDMRIPLAYAMGYPTRLPLPIRPLDLPRLDRLTFERPRRQSFPCLAYAYEVLRIGRTMPAVLNAANEVAVEAYLEDRIGFLGIPRVLHDTLEEHKPWPVRGLEDVLAADAWARDVAKRIVKGRSEALR